MNCMSSTTSQLPIFFEGEKQRVGQFILWQFQIHCCYVIVKQNTPTVYR